MSLSARRAWIEIFYYADKDCDWVRSLSARRAWIEIAGWFPDCRVFAVALRKESVDRNPFAQVCQCVTGKSLSARRAWIEMLERYPRGIAALQSLSARRAWIEIKIPRAITDTGLSLSARRAWIEIASRKTEDEIVQVALRKESVDRNVPEPEPAVL